MDQSPTDGHVGAMTRTTLGKLIWGDKPKEHRPNYNERGYDGEWRKFRKTFLYCNPLCADCRRVATEVHHIAKVRDRPDLRLDVNNCMPLCKSCHSKRTARGINEG